MISKQAQRVNKDLRWKAKLDDAAAIFDTRKLTNEEIVKDSDAKIDKLAE